MTGAKTWIELAQYQRPGVKIILGPAEGREEQITPLSYLDLKKLPQFKWGEASPTMRSERKDSLMQKRKELEEELSRLQDEAFKINHAAMTIRKLLSESRDSYLWP